MIGVGREFYWRLVVTTFFSLVVGILIFFLTPRQDFRITALETRGENWRSPTATSFLNAVGFAQEIRLGSLGTVLDNPTEVMNVSFKQPREVTSTDASDETDYTTIRNQSVYFRGVALQNYARGRWSGDEVKSLPVFPIFPTTQEIDPKRRPAAVPSPLERSEMQFVPGSQLVHVNCEYFSLEQETLFAIWPYFLTESRPGGRIRFDNDRITRTRPNSSGFSNFASRPGAPRRQLVFHFLTWGFRNGEQLDLIPCQEEVNSRSLLAFDDLALPTVSQIAQQWDAPASDRGMIARAQNLENRLMTDERFYYALGGIARSPSIDPLEDFVRDHPGGHCEYFAGALAMMLRSVGIPARVIVGYRLDTEAGQLGGRQERYVVRQSDAHSWVEAYIPPREIPESLRNGPHGEWWQHGGWLRLDPTAPLRDVIAQTGFWAALKFHATGFWNDYVINFNATRQEGAVYFPIAEFFTSMKERFLDAQYWKTIGRDVLQRYTEIFRSLRQGNWQGSDLVLLGIPPMILAIMGYIIYRVVRRVIREVHALRLNREKQRKFATIGFYLRFEKILQSLGLIRQPTETQREFARRCVPVVVTMTDLPGHVAETFYRVRYGDVTLTPAETDEMNVMLSRLEKNSEP
jgi:hypothetical protein